MACCPIFVCGQARRRGHTDMAIVIYRFCWSEKLKGLHCGMLTVYYGEINTHRVGKKSGLFFISELITLQQLVVEGVYYVKSFQILSRNKLWNLHACEFI